MSACKCQDLQHAYNLLWSDITFSRQYCLSSLLALVQWAYGMPDSVAEGGDTASPAKFMYALNVKVTKVLIVLLDEPCITGSGYCRAVPYPSQSTGALYDAIRSPEPVLLPETPAVSPQLLNLLGRLLDKDPASRCKLDMVREAAVVKFLAFRLLCFSLSLHFNQNLWVTQGKLSAGTAPFPEAT